MSAAASGISAPLQGHPGGLNSEGCHNNRKTGEYHCHRAPVEEGVRAVLAASLSMGTLHLTLGNVLAFAFTVWAVRRVTREQAAVAVSS